MRKLVMFNLVSIDGYFAGEDGSLDWQIVDEEFNKAAVMMIAAYDTILFGRVTYELFESYWPKAAEDPNTSDEDIVIAEKINGMKKIVISQSLPQVTWANTRLVRDNIIEEVRQLKAEEGGDIVIYGSGSLVRALTNVGLIDEYQFMVNPIILGSGKLLFHDINTVKLKRIDTKAFASGNTLLTYQREA